MLVEHSFITTLDAPETLEIVAQMLSGLGFTETVGNARVNAQSKVSREFVLPGGRPRAAANTWVQRVLVTFDRGRVTVATTATPPARRAFRYRSSTLTRSQKAMLEEKLVLTSGVVEAILMGEPMDSIQSRWDALNSRWRAADIRRRRRTTIITLTVFALLVLLIVGLAVLARH